MVTNEPSAQLNTELQHSVENAQTSRRPLLHHLNADTSWLLQIPQPDDAIQRGGRIFYNILIDPWFVGGQSDVASWFSQQFHATPSAVQSIAELEELIREGETLGSGLKLAKGTKTNSKAKTKPKLKWEQGSPDSLIDAIAISHEFTDHCHKDTLREINPDVPVFAIKEAAELIKKWKHFKTVQIVKSFGANDDKDWRSTSIAPLPEWIGISRMLQENDVLYYHSALMFAFNNKHGTSMNKKATDVDPAEAVLYTPHGIESGDLSLIPEASPPISTLAFLHGLHNVRVGTASGRTALQSNLGAHNGLKAQRILNANYWIGTHDEIKKGGGLVSWFLQRDIITIKDALDQERKASKDGKVNGEVKKTVESFDDTNWVDLKNGESLVLQ